MRALGKRMRTRRRPGQCSTRSWQAAYNLACVYAAIAHDRQRRGRNDDARDFVGKVITSLEFAINNPECEMERPGEWIAADPDFRCLQTKHDQSCARFSHFLAVQKRRDYPRHGGTSSWEHIRRIRLRPATDAASPGASRNGQLAARNGWLATRTGRAAGRPPD